MSRKWLLPFLPLALLLAKSAAQDTIVFENKIRLPILIVEERDDEILYRRPIFPKGPIYVIRKRFVSEVEYEDPASRSSKYKPSPHRPGRDLDVWVTPLSNPLETKGLLHHLDDTTLMVRKKTGWLEAGGKVNPEEVKVFPYENIHLIKVRKRNQIRQFAIWGAVGGFAIGFVGGLLFANDSPPCKPLVDGGGCDASLHSPRNKLEKSLALGFGMGAGGALTGATFGALRVTYNISGKKDNFNRTIPKLERQSRMQSK
ncbi:MAG: hypothetical protein AAB316_23720 [Bacteroidota bacterium]